MPGRDQTGPYGTGANGRGLGPCRDEAESGFFGRFGRRGRRFGRGLGRRGSGFWRTPDTQDLQAEESYLKQRLAAIQEKLNR